MWDLLGAAVRGINHAGMQTLDWVIVIGMIVFLILVIQRRARFRLTLGLSLRHGSTGEEQAHG